MTRGQHAHYARPSTGISSRVRQICSSPASTVCAALIALTLLACVAPPAYGSGGLCDRALHAGWVEYELMDVQHEIEGGEFLGLCVNSKYRIFDIFLDAGPGGELVLEMPRAWFDPRQFDRRACDFGYGINGESSKHEGVRAEIDHPVDQHMTIQFDWDVHVWQISYAKSPVTCLERQDIRDHVWDTPLSALRGLWYGEYHAVIDAHCASPWANVIRLNHTISGGTLDRVCSMHERELVLDISPDTFGELIVDMPHDVFPPHTGAFEFHPVTGELVDAAYHRHPFTITTWNKYSMPYSTTELYHAEIQFRRTFEVVHMYSMEDQPDSFSRFIGCRDAQHPCFPIPFFWGRLAHKISSHDSFDRYSIPFGTDDVRIVLWAHNVLRPGLDNYHPEKYRVQESQEEFWRDLLRTRRAGQASWRAGGAYALPCARQTAVTRNRELRL